MVSNRLGSANVDGVVRPCWPVWTGHWKSHLARILVISSNDVASTRRRIRSLLGNFTAEFQFVMEPAND